MFLFNNNNSLDQTPGKKESIIRLVETRIEIVTEIGKEIVQKTTIEIGTVNVIVKGNANGIANVIATETEQIEAIGTKKETDITKEVTLTVTITGQPAINEVKDVVEQPEQHRQLIDTISNQQEANLVQESVLLLLQLIGALLVTMKKISLKSEVLVKTSNLKKKLRFRLNKKKLKICENL